MKSKLHKSIRYGALAVLAVLASAGPAAVCWTTWSADVAPDAAQPIVAGTDPADRPFLPYEPAHPTYPAGGWETLFAAAR